MSTSRAKLRLAASQNKEEVSLDHFYQLGSSVITNLIKSQQPDHKRKFKKVTSENNSLLLLVSLNYVCDHLSNNNLAQLVDELEADIPLELFQSLPSQFEGYYQPQTVKSILSVGCTHVSRAKGQAQLENDMTKLVNDYPFFRCCLIMWARGKAVSYLETHQASFDILIGNEKEVLLDFSKQLRYISLDVFVQAFNLKLTLQLGQTSETYGLDIEFTKEICVTVDNRDNMSILVEDTLSKDNQTDNTQNDSQNQIFGRGLNKSSKASEVFSAHSPRSAVDGSKCAKCGNKMRMGRCVRCKEQSSEKPKKTSIFEHYISVMKVCQECGRKEIIYRELCRKCELTKSR